MASVGKGRLDFFWGGRCQKKKIVWLIVWSRPLRK